jgi:hypothetical protein
MKGFKGLKMSVLAGAVALGAVAQASFFSVLDVRILLDKASNGSTLTVRYTGGKAELAELRINGVSKATRALSSEADRGETSFDLQGAWLNDGQNLVEIVLIDKSGKVIGKQKTTVEVDRTADGPVYISSPKNGATVQGAIEIKLGFATAMSNIYASFFMNGDFKSIRNYPPYSFVWDTTRADNGWHELSATIVDQSGSTFKTNPIRIFVNNPGGRTNRNTTPATNPALPKTSEAVSPEATPKSIDLSPAVEPVAAGTGKASGLKGTNAAGEMVAGAKGSPVSPALRGAPAVPAAIAQTGKSVGTKAMTPDYGVNMTGKLMTPTGNRVLATQTELKGATGSEKTLKTVPPATEPSTLARIEPKEPKIKTPTTKAEPKLIAIEPGVKVPNLGQLTVLFNSTTVAFDVAPRVMAGIPIAPFRHLFEENGGKVEWVHELKQVRAFDASTEVIFTIGSKDVALNGKKIGIEVTPFLERGRSMVPLSFIKEVLNVDVKVDPKSGHVLITAEKK